MDDLISRQAAIDALGDAPEVWTDDSEYDRGLNNQWRYDRNAIMAVPPTQPEQETGQWIRFKYKDGNWHIKCSKCGQYWSVDGHAKIFKYCFNCGLKMEE